MAEPEIIKKKENQLSNIKECEKSEEMADEIELEITNQLGLYLIVDGHCIVKNHDDEFESKKLVKGDFFGESDILKCAGYSFFGDIYALSEKVECWFIPLEKFNRIPLYE